MAEKHKFSFCFVMCKYFTSSLVFPMTCAKVHENQFINFSEKVQETREWKVVSVGIISWQTGLCVCVWKCLFSAMKSDVQVRFSPSAEVTEGQRVSLTCSTHCPLTHNKNYIWYLNRQLLREPQYKNKHLVLDPVRAQHAGNYSCSVTTQIQSPEKTLVVRSSSFQWREAAAVGVGAAALVFITLAVVCWIR